MNENKLFKQTRTYLAFCYAGVMGVILSGLALGVYHAIAHAHKVAIDYELESVSGTLHDSLEVKLTTPGKVDAIVREFLPNLCIVGEKCYKKMASNRHTLSVIHQERYYFRLFDTSGKLIAIAGIYPYGISPQLNKKYWQTFRDDKGMVYQQISLSLHTRDMQDWGYFQMGRNLQDFEDYLNAVRWVLKLGVPVSLILVGGASWWLAGIAMQPIYKSYRQIEQFTADAAHELRTPLAASLATVESAFFIPNLNEKEAREILQTIERQNRRLSQLVADLLLLTRMDRQTMPVRRQVCCLNDIVCDIVEELAALSLAAKVTLSAEIRVNESLNVAGNSEQLYRLFCNLIMNGIQYTPAGGNVKVVLFRSDHQATIEIKDTGIGIAPEEQKRIFDRFYRVNIDRSRHSGGAGLGLAIALAITQAHQGSLTVDSKLGKGCNFRVLLPLKK